MLSKGYGEDFEAFGVFGFRVDRNWPRAEELGDL